MADKMYFGVPGAIEEIPCPQTGMGFANNLDSDEVPLVSGGRSFFRSPTTYKSFNMSWTGGSYSLRHLMDCYNGQFGSGPYYLTDPTAEQVNVLPARWSAAWQLAHQSNGWANPVITDIATPQTPDLNRPRVGKKVKWTQAGTGSSVPLEGIVKTRTIRIPGKPYYLSAYGVATGGAGIRVRGYRADTNAWVLLSTFTTFTGATTLVLADTDTLYSMLELDLYLPLNSTLELQGVALGSMSYRVPGNILNINYAQAARGVGGFTTHWNAAAGTAGTASIVAYDNVYPYRKNWAQNPQATSTTRFATYITGTTEVVSQTFLTGQVDGPIPEITNYSKFSITTAKTAGSTGVGSTGGAQRNPVVGSAGESATVSTWVRYNGPGTLDGRMRASVYTAAGATINSADAATVTLTSGVWTRVTSTVVAAAAFFTVGWWFYQLSGQIAPAGSSIDCTGVLIEKNTGMNNYFDGTFPVNGDYSYIWEGAANGSVSQERLPAKGPDGRYGFVQYRQIDEGTGGSVGPYHRDTSGLNAGTTGDARYVTAWVRVSSSRQVRLSSAFKDNANLDVGPTNLTSFVTMSPGIWYKLESGKMTATAPFTRFQAWPSTVASPGVPIPSEFTFDVILLITNQPSEYYFDGLTPDTAYKYYSYEGTFANSRSFESDHKPYVWMPQGEGVGAVQFSGTNGGTLTSAIIDRIGLSVDLTEVQNVESRAM